MLAPRVEFCRLDGSFDKDGSTCRESFFAVSPLGKDGVSIPEQSPCALPQAGSARSQASAKILPDFAGKNHLLGQKWSILIQIGPFKFRVFNKAVIVVERHEPIPESDKPLFAQQPQYAVYVNRA